MKAVFGLLLGFRLAAASPAQSDRLAKPGCIMEQEVGYFGNDLKPSKTKETANKQECADYSASTPGSLFWTWDKRTKKCFLKSSKAGREKHHNSVSGNSECGSGQCTSTQLAQAGTVAFAVDTTASMQKAIPIAQDAIVNLVNSGSHIPKWILTDFKANGYFNDSSGVRVVTDTQDPEQLKTDVTSLPIGGGGQEEVLLAIQRTLGVMPDNGVILVFTDEPTTQLDLESAVTAEATRKNVKVFFALLGDPGQESEQVYERVSEGRVFRANSTAGTLDFDSKSFFDAIIYQVQHTSCIGTTPPAGTTDPGTTPPAVTTDPGNTSPGEHVSTIASKTGTGKYAGSKSRVVAEICDAQGTCCQTSSDGRGLDNSKVVRQAGQTDVYTRHSNPWQLFA